MNGAPPVPGEEDEHLAADQREQRLERGLVVEKSRVVGFAAAEEPAHRPPPAGSGRALSTRPSSRISSLAADGRRPCTQAGRAAGSVRRSTVRDTDGLDGDWKVYAPDSLAQNVRSRIEPERQDRLRPREPRGRGGTVHGSPRGGRRRPRKTESAMQRSLDGDRGEDSHRLAGRARRPGRAGAAVGVTQLQRRSPDETSRVAAAFHAQAALPALPPVVASVSGADGLSRLRPADLSGERQAPPLLRFVGGRLLP